MAIRLKEYSTVCLIDQQRLGFGLLALEVLGEKEEIDGETRLWASGAKQRVRRLIESNEAGYDEPEYPYLAAYRQASATIASRLRDE